jgi:predicted ATPase
MEELAKKSGCLPWVDLTCFAEKALERMVAAYHAVADKALVFFDRGIPDIIAYLRAAALPVSEKYDAAIRQYPYHRTVFLLPPWQEIYVKDNARWQTFEEAEAIYHCIKATYQSVGYHITELPKSTLEQRVQFIQHCLNEISILKPL